MANDSDQEELRRFLATNKTITGKLTWKGKGRLDYSEALKIITCPEMPEINAQLRLSAHKTRVPPKYGFTLLVGSVRLLGLDVNPGSSHYNHRTMESVSSTHWQSYPVQEAEPDEQMLTHREWLEAFLKRANVASSLEYAAPPHTPEQLSML